MVIGRHLIIFVLELPNRSKLKRMYGTMYSCSSHIARTIKHMITNDHLNNVTQHSQRHKVRTCSSSLKKSCSRHQGRTTQFCRRQSFSLPAPGQQIAKLSDPSASAPRDETIRAPTHLSPKPCHCPVVVVSHAPRPSRVAQQFDAGHEGQGAQTLGH